MKSKVKVFFAIAIFVLVFLTFFAVKISLRKGLPLNFDADYYWAAKTFDDSLWF